MTVLIAQRACVGSAGSSRVGGGGSSTVLSEWSLKYTRSKVWSVCGQVAQTFFSSRSVRWTDWYRITPLTLLTHSPSISSSQSPWTRSAPHAPSAAAFASIASRTMSLRSTARGGLCLLSRPTDRPMVGRRAPFCPAPSGLSAERSERWRTDVAYTLQIVL